MKKFPIIKEKEFLTNHLELLKILLKNQTTKQNIIWTNKNSFHKEKDFVCEDDFLKSKSLLNKKSLHTKTEKNHRIKKMGEVFTPSWICNIQNNIIDKEWFGYDNAFNVIKNKTWVRTKKVFFSNKNWKEYVKDLRLEITCGQAPYVVSRYDNTTYKKIDLLRRIGLLDRKLRVVCENTKQEKEWTKYALIALKSVYGFEYQADNLFIARTNILFSFIDYYFYMFNKLPDNELLIQVCEIITWNFWQMDGLKLTILLSCQNKTISQLTIFGQQNTCEECEGCLTNNVYLHNGLRCLIMNWQENKVIRYIDLLNNKQNTFKFNAIVGNPSYQDENHLKIYPYFYKLAIQLGNYVSLIFPTGWQEPKTKNNLDVMNTPEIKEDKQIVFIDNKENVFEKVGIKWVNIIFWKRNYDNGLNGQQMIYTNGKNPVYKKLACENDIKNKPQEILLLKQCVINKGNFVSIEEYTSKTKPYGLRTYVLKDPTKYKLYFDKPCENAIKFYVPKMLLWLKSQDDLPKISVAFTKYKVLVPYAWGGMENNASAYLGGSYAGVIIANPYEACSETYLESGIFDDFETAQKHAKYLMTKFLRALLYLNKFSQHSTRSWHDIPKQTYEEEWWNLSVNEIDDKLFEKYDVPEIVKNFVKERIQPKTQNDIVNFNELEKKTN